MALAETYQVGIGKIIIGKNIKILPIAKRSLISMHGMPVFSCVNHWNSLEMYTSLILLN